MEIADNKFQELKESIEEFLDRKKAFYDNLRPIPTDTNTAEYLALINFKYDTSKVLSAKLSDQTDLVYKLLAAILNPEDKENKDA